MLHQVLIRLGLVQPGDAPPVDGTESFPTAGKPRAQVSMAPIGFLAHVDQLVEGGRARRARVNAPVHRWG